MAFETRWFVAVGAALKREHSILAVGEIEAPALLQPDSKALLLELAVEFDAVLDDLSLVARTEEAQDSGAVLGGAIRNLALSEIYFKRKTRNPLFSLGFSLPLPRKRSKLSIMHS